MPKNVASNVGRQMPLDVVKRALKGRQLNKFRYGGGVMSWEKKEVDSLSGSTWMRSCNLAGNIYLAHLKNDPYVHFNVENPASISMKQPG
jgi:hypothetical protein